MNADLSETSLPAARPQRLVVGITGASGVILGIRLLEMLRPMPVETHLVLSPAGRATIAQETDWKVSDVMALADATYNHADIGATIASGSFGACRRASRIPLNCASSTSRCSSSRIC